MPFCIVLYRRNCLVNAVHRDLKIKEFKAEENIYHLARENIVGLLSSTYSDADYSGLFSHLSHKDSSRIGSNILKVVILMTKYVWSTSQLINVDISHVSFTCFTFTAMSVDLKLMMYCPMYCFLPTNATQMSL